jgi:hypothetical protein
VGAVCLAPLPRPTLDLDGEARQGEGRNPVSTVRPVGVGGGLIFPGGPLTRRLTPHVSGFPYWDLGNRDLLLHLVR